MRYLALVLAVSLLVACESDQKKLERLRHDDAITLLDVIYAREKAKAHGDTSKWADSLRTAETRHELARRDLRKFLDGR